MNHSLHTAATLEQQQVAERDRQREILRRQTERRAASCAPAPVTWVSRALHPIRTARVAVAH